MKKSKKSATILNHLTRLEDDRPDTLMEVAVSIYDQLMVVDDHEDRVRVLAAVSMLHRMCAVAPGVVV